MYYKSVLYRATKKQVRISRKFNPVLQVQGLSHRTVPCRIQHHGRCRTLVICPGRECVTLRIDCHQNTVSSIPSLISALLIGQTDTAKRSMHQAFASLANTCQFRNHIIQFILNRTVEAGTQCRIPILFVPLRSPLASVIDARNSGHSEKHCIEQWKMILVIQNRRRTCNIMIVDKR